VECETRYARNGDVHIAYQVLGDGPLDLVFVPAFVSNLEVAWEEPSLARFYRRLASFSRLILIDKRGTGLSDRVPADALPTLEDSQIDVRPLLESVRVPTLVIYRGGEYFTHVEGSRYLAEHIPGAKQVELPGSDFLPWVGDQDALLDEIEEFLTGARVGGHSSDRVLATVLFTDIMGSTEKAAELGDRRWRNLLDDYYDAARREIERSRGRMVKTLGDGILATFDGPARAVRCASVLRQTVEHLGIRIRTGVHTGECERMGDDVGGIAVHIGARVAAQAAPDEVLVSSTVKDLVAGSGLRFVDRGTYHLHGVPGSDASSPPRESPARVGHSRADLRRVGRSVRTRRVQRASGGEQARGVARSLLPDVPFLPDTNLSGLN
jgi:class 3 adenylate cyclase